MKKHLPLILTLFIVFQSCKIYDSRSSTREDALLFGGKVKVKSVSNSSYKFERIIIENDTLYGVGKKLNSKSKIEFNNNIVNKNPTDKYVKILLTDNLVNEIHLFNKGKTTALKVVGFGAIALYTLALFVTVAVIAVALG